MGHEVLLGILNMMQKSGERGHWVTLPVCEGYRFHKYPKDRIIRENYIHNKKQFEEHLPEVALDGGFIEKQSLYTDMRLGVCPFSFCGCEVIALYNALNRLEPGGKYLKSLPQLICRMEEKGVLHGGQFGTAPGALVDFLRELGYTAILSSNPGKYREIAAYSRVLILTYYNKKRSLRSMIHTICITVKGRGLFSPGAGKGKGTGKGTEKAEKHQETELRFRAHNAGLKEEFTDLTELIGQLGVEGKADPVCLIGVR